MDLEGLVLYITTVFILIAGLIYSLNNLGKNAPKPTLPPGPKGIPLLGNVLNLPKSQPWLTFAKWGQIYGKIMHISTLGKSIIILNDAQYAVDMLNKKSRIYSERPKLIMAGHLVGWDQSMALIPTGSTEWASYRRSFMQFIGARAKVEGFEHVLQEQRNVFVKRVLDNPTAWVRHSYTYAGSIALMLAYGYKPKEKGDEILRAVNEGMEQFSETTASGAYLVDVLPVLRHVPQWFPGASWKKKIPIYRQTLQDMVNLPYEWTKQQLLAGSITQCYVSEALSEGEITHEVETMIKWTANGMYAGGSDTSVAGIKAFFLAMTLQVPAQMKAQSEIDSAIGRDRLPTLADRHSLPYVEGLFLEMFRFYTFSPLGFPHVLVEDDVHEGYFIPKGSFVIPNVWQFFNDPKIYKNPTVFSPERFMLSESSTPETDPREYHFGFGRRACPGIHLADASMWLICASMLSAFDIRPLVENGEVRLPSGKFMDGTISHPEPFECVITPRSKASEHLICLL